MKYKKFIIFACRCFYKDINTSVHIDIFSLIQQKNKPGLPYIFQKIAVLCFIFAHLFIWEGVPYAEPPVGKMRFEPPQPLEHNWAETFDATRGYNACIQWNHLQSGTNKLRGVEDCLTVNIYAPKCNRSRKLPVMIFIHGGCFMFGGDDFTADYLMESSRIIWVNILYRLGPMGFLSTEDDIIPGNFGLKDQQLALQWIKKNIVHFGGDPSKILLTGFSAGGAATHMHTLQPSIGSVATVAASFSGVALNPWVIIKNSRANAFKLAELMNCRQTTSTLEIKQCLQQKDAAELVTAVQHFLSFGYNPFTVFGPVVEHKNVSRPFLNRHPLDIMRDGNLPKIPWLVSFTSEDGGYNCAEAMSIDPKTGRELIYEYNERWLEMAPINFFLRHIKDDPVKYAMELREKYMGNLTFSPENYLQFQKICTDVLFVNGIIQSMQLMSQNNAKPVYGYEYRNPADYSIVGFLLSGRRDFYFGTNHADDLSLLLKLAVRSHLRADEKLISKKLIEMLIGFVETGKPTYDKCDLPNNSGAHSSDMELTLITSDSCGTVQKSVEGLRTRRNKWKLYT